MTFLTELERLKGAATKGPWRWDGSDLWHVGFGYDDADDPHRYTGVRYDERLEKSPILHANKDLICFLRNHADALAELVRAAEKRAVHRECEDSWYSCPKSPEGCANPGEGEACNCGADDLINALAALDKERK